jgi:cephalosporin hydroxylase
LITTIDTDVGIVTVDDGERLQTFELATPKAFSAITDAYLRCGWDNKYVYSFTWMGRPIIQLPDDIVRIQELIYTVRPDIIIDIGIAHGGSLIAEASLLKAMGNGRVIGVDIEIRPHNRKAIVDHEMFPLITLIEGDSIAKKTVDLIADEISINDRVLVLLDGCHSKDHVYRELELYSPFVTLDSYIVAMDGIMKDLVGAPRSQPDWVSNNPSAAAREFVELHKEFVIEKTIASFNESSVTDFPTYFPEGYIKRIK